jgi:anti-anti-sigma factor
VALELDGEFDVVEAPKILEQADRLLDDDKHLIIDLSAARFIDSAVIHALFRTDANARGQGRTFVLQLGTGSGVGAVLAITGADRGLDTAPTREAAIDVIERSLSSRGDGRRPGAR